MQEQKYMLILDSLGRAALLSLKYLVVCPPFITHDSLFFSNTLIQSIKLSPKPYFLRTAMKK